MMKKIVKVVSHVLHQMKFFKMYDLKLLSYFLHHMNFFKIHVRKLHDEENIYKCITKINIFQL